MSGIKRQQLFQNTTVQQPLDFGTRSTHISFPCSTKYSKSINCKVPQPLRKFGTKKSDLIKLTLTKSSQN
jgi:hypothetical protein